MINANDHRALIDKQLSLVQAGSNTLDLQSFNISDVDLQYITQNTPHQIQVVQLGKNDLGSEAAVKLSLCPWSNLLVLELSYNKISDRGCRFLVKGQWKKLQQLWLFRNQIGEVGASHLSKGNWKDLILLHLSNNHIDNGIKFLVKGNWKHLIKLYLRWNQIQLFNLMAILKANWASIKTLWIKNNLDNEEQRNSINCWIHKKWQLSQLIIW